MKKFAVALIFTCGLLLVSSRPVLADTTTEPSTSTEEPESSEEEPLPSTGNIKIRYVDVDTQENIVPSVTHSGEHGTTVPIDLKEIEDYTLADVLLVDELEILEKDYVFPIHYMKKNQPPANTEEPETTETSSVPEGTTSTTENSTTNPDQVPKSSEQTEKTEAFSSETSSQAEESTTSSTESTRETTTDSTKTPTKTEPTSSSDKPSKKKQGLNLPKTSNHRDDLLTFAGCLIFTTPFLFKLLKK
ncbi:MucBP domain-containing protein [Vagococcus salmoninarum]|uniref:MucBP domain-containing protein n=1 Tax=Vagococcus salmoninarum TaxID=2739 RepID=UPI00187FBE60|nr:MucBP domain-containing protein [Vagococcus salmoninarum]MBE9390455.1 MucBP domain-containing protein [Vagococcus salmoninarum]